MEMRVSSIMNKILTKKMMNVITALIFSKIKAAGNRIKNIVSRLSASLSELFTDLLYVLNTVIPNNKSNFYSDKSKKIRSAVAGGFYFDRSALMEVFIANNAGLRADNRYKFY